MEANLKIKLFMKRFGLLISLLMGIFIFSSCEAADDGLKIDQSSLNYNVFHHQDGLFEFEYKNNYEVRNVEDIYFLQELSTENISFQIFENNDEITFEETAFICEDDDGIEVCYSKGSPDFIVQNLTLFAGEKNDRYDFLTRAEVLEILLEMKYPEIDFDDHADDCFLDVSKKDKRSGYVCFAKENGFVVGIADNFYSDSGINLWGTLKLLFLIFEEDDYSFDYSKLNEDVFGKMTIYHYAYDLIAKASYEGIINNPRQVDFWPNRVLYLSEFDDIVDTFLVWQDGKTLRDYEYSDGFNLENKIYIKGFYKDLTFEEDDLDDFKNKNLYPTILKNTEDGVEIYVEESPAVYQYIYTLWGVDEENIDEVKVNYNKERIKVRVYVKFKDREDAHYKLEISQNQFAYLKSSDESEINDPNLSPNDTKSFDDDNLTSYKLYMSDEDFNNILDDRTLETRYPAYLEIYYSNDDVETHSVVIKTRGNANRGYIKSSFTVESFDDFFNDEDEIKLRSMISDETLIKEKLAYSSFEKLGYVAPQFSETILSINNVPFGFYQVTEAIKDDFFKRRNLDVDNYYYARNISSPYLANLTSLEDEGILITHYDAKGDEDYEKLSNFIEALADGDADLINTINIQNVFDYAMFCHILTLNDSYTHNYYLYIDEDTKLWNIFFWDVDAGMEIVPEFSKEAFKTFVAVNEGWYNALIHYVFERISDEEFDLMLADFKQRWEENVDIVNQLDYYFSNYEDAFEYDNDLWNGKYLERKEKWFDTSISIENLKIILEEVESSVGIF